jgi:hypothetical protein
MARLDRLGPVTKEVAQSGAAIGREFGFGLLASVADLPERELREALDRLTNAGLLFVRGTPPDAVYTFKHALVQDYERLHPQTKHGGAPGKAGGGKIPVAKDADSAPFVKATAKASGRSTRSVEVDATRSKHIPMLAHCVDTSLDKYEELDALAKLPPAKQKELITRARSG